MPSPSFFYLPPALCGLRPLFGTMCIGTGGLGGTGTSHYHFVPGPPIVIVIVIDMGGGEEQGTRFGGKIGEGKRERVKEQDKPIVKFNFLNKRLIIRLIILLLLNRLNIMV